MTELDINDVALNGAIVGYSVGVGVLGVVVVKRGLSVVVLLLVGAIEVLLFASLSSLIHKVVSKQIQSAGGHFTFPLPIVPLALLLLLLFVAIQEGVTIPALPSNGQSCHT